MTELTIAQRENLLISGGAVKVSGSSKPDVYTIPDEALTGPGYFYLQRATSGMSGMCVRQPSVEAVVSFLKNTYQHLLTVVDGGDDWYYVKGL